MFHASMFAARADSLVQRIIGAGGPEFDAIALAEPRDRGFVQNDFTDRSQLNLGQFLGRALGGRVEPAGTVERVAKQIKADRPPLPRWKDIDNPAAHGVVARLHHVGGLGKTHACQKVAQRSFINA